MSMTTVIHDSPSWHDLRARHVGGSEIAALFDLAPEDTPNYLRSRFALWHIKAGNAPPPVVDNPRVKWGLRLEALIAEAAGEENKWSVQKGGYVSDINCEGLGCTLDYVIDYDPEERGPGALEIKNVDWLVHKRSWETEPPPHILLQHQHQLAATGYSWGAVCCLIGGNDLRTYRYKARPRIIEDIRRRVTDFWRSIDEGREPPIDGSESASAIIQALHPVVVDDSVDMRENNEFAEAAYTFFNAGKSRAVADKEYDSAKNRIAQLLAGHKSAWGNGWYVNTAITPENLGHEPKSGELIGKKKEVRRYTVKEMSK